MDDQQQLQLLLQQESELQFAEFTNDTAVALGLKLVETARARNCSVTVSGLPQFEDHELVVEVLREFLGSDRR